MSNVSVIGLGAMGFRMAQRLLKAGHEVVVYNRTKERASAIESEGARLAASPREAAERSDILISMVTDDNASRSVWLDKETGAANGLRYGSIAIESSTLTPAWVSMLANAVSSCDARFLDAPVVGSRPQADAGELIYLIGGEAETIEKVSGTLSAMGSLIHHVGPVGSGAAMKLAVNALFGIQVAALGEVLGLLGKLNFEESKAIDLLVSLPIASPAMKRISGLIAAREFAPKFPVHLVEKDFGYLVETAKQVNALSPICEAVRKVYESAKREQLGQIDISGVSQLFN
jgi:3-hydroxyisobutyrate dehydrogenase-like beta-hydroxyacid dehydrogenase